MTMQKFWKLDSPKMCRDFLKSLRLGPEGGKITFLQQADGKQVSIDVASDQQVMEVCRQFAEVIGTGKPNRSRR